MKTDIGHIRTKTQKVLVSFEHVDFFDRDHQQRTEQFLKDCFEAEKRGGCYFKNMGDIARERKETQCVKR